MALALPDENVAWRYAIHSGNPITPVEEDGVPYALAAACEAPMWRGKGRVHFGRRPRAYRRPGL